MKNIEDVILFQIERTSKVSKIYSQREFDKINFGITIDQWILLKIIEENEQLSQKQLAKLSSRDPASITRTLDILEKKDFIKREPIPGNRRQYNVILTKQGKQFVEDHLETVISHRKKSIEGFSTEELQQLRQMLLKIQKNMS
ncbi:MAG: MarR family transcriptional regulator [Bacteroidota bacterium]